MIRRPRRTCDRQDRGRAAIARRDAGRRDPDARLRPNIADWEAVARAHGARFAAIQPANTLIAAALVGDEYLVEIEAEADVGSGDA
jgi:hypothetical protein